MNNDLKFLKFEEACRKYLYEKEMMKELETRFVRYNVSNTHYNDNAGRNDPLKRYRLMESHIRQVDDVFRSIEKKYGMKVAQKIRSQLVYSYSLEEKKELQENYRNTVLYALNHKDRYYGGHI